MEIQLNYMEGGEGFPLILLHGNGEDHSYFQYQMEPFSVKYRVIAPGTRGHGKSPRGTAPFTLNQFADDLKDFLDNLKIKQCYLLVFSDGANIALLFTLKYPNYVEKLILNGADLYPSAVKLSTQIPIVLGWVLLQIVRQFNKKIQLRWELLDLMTTQPHINPKMLSALTMATLIVAGERDMIRESHTRLIAKSIPQSKLLILPGDHFVARRNWQAFNPAVLEFLEE